MPKKTRFNDKRDLTSFSARIYQPDHEDLIKIAAKTGVREEDWACSALTLFVRAYQRDGYLLLPSVMVPEEIEIENRNEFAKQIEKEEELFHAKTVPTIPQSYRYLNDDLDILEIIASRTSSTPSAYLRLSLHLFIMMYRRYSGKLPLPAVVYSLRDLTIEK
jgi:hypothetical protein